MENCSLPSFPFISPKKELLEINPESFFFFFPQWKQNIRLGWSDRHRWFWVVLLMGDKVLLQIICDCCVSIAWWREGVTTAQVHSGPCQLCDPTACGFGLQACEALAFGSQLWAGLELRLPGPIWSPHKGNRVTQTDALPTRCFLWHYIRLWCDEYIPYPPFPSLCFSLCVLCWLDGLIVHCQGI